MRHRTTWTMVVALLGLGGAAASGLVKAADKASEGVQAASAALQPGRTPQGVPYLSGGVGLEEREAMRQQAGPYSLRLITALQGSGEYVDGAEAVVADRHGRELTRVRLDGPWLYLDLAPGAYQVSMYWNNQVLHQRVRINAGRSTSAVFHFRSP